MSFHNIENITCLIIGSGSQNELPSFNGIAHISEHIVLLKLLENNNFLSVSGVTNFDNTKFIINSSYKFNVDFFIHFLNKMILTEKDLEKCKYQVLNEIHDKEENQWTYLKKIYSFLIDKQSVNLPIGDEQRVKKITLDNIIEFVHENYYNHIFIQLWNGSLEYKKYPGLTSKNKILDDKKIKSNILFYPYKSDDNMILYEYFFHINFRYMNIKIMALKLLFEIIIEQKMSLYDNYREQKMIKYVRINHDYLFFKISYKISHSKIFNIENEMFDLFEFLKNVFIDNGDLTCAKIALHNYLEAARHARKKYVIDQIANHFLYGYPLVIDNRSFNEFSIAIDSISVDEINNFRYNILCISPKVIITGNEL